MLVGTHLIRSWSKTQSVIALSSAESEFYATLKAAQESLGMVAMFGEMGQKAMKIRVLVDASAALGVAQRQGLGKLRHLQTGALWIQEQEIKKRMQLAKVAGTDNVSDVLTKNVTREILERHMDNLKAEFKSDKAEKAIELHLVKRQVRQAKAVLNGLKKSKRSDQCMLELNEVDVDHMLDELQSVVEQDELAADKFFLQQIDEWERKLCREEGMWLKLAGG